MPYISLTYHDCFGWSADLHHDSPYWNHMLGSCPPHRMRDAFNEAIRFCRNHGTSLLITADRQSWHLAQNYRKFCETQNHEND